MLFFREPRFFKDYRLGKLIHERLTTFETYMTLQPGDPNGNTFVTVL